MATAVCHRQEIGTWQSIFPPDQLTEKKSAFFVKKLLAVSVSYLTYLRNIFPEKAYSNRNLEDLELKILSDSSSCPGANKVCHWIRSCFEALDKKFLNSLVLGLYIDPTDSNTLLESYSFKFNYEDGVDIYHNDKKILTSDTENTKKTTTTLLRTILVLTQGLKPLPDNVMLTMKLYFNDEVTPSDYHPAGFMESKCDDFSYDDETVNIKVGEVNTKFHSVKMRIRTKCHNFDLSPDAKEIVAELTDGSQEEKEETLMTSASPADTVMTSVTTPKTDGGSYDVNCVCGSSIEDGMLIMCVSCEKWSHGLCYRILDSDAVPESHTCARCPGECTDPSFKKMDKITVQATALWRRALFTLTEVKRVKEPELAQRLDIDIEVAKKLITRLLSERFIKAPAKSRSNFGYIVNKAEITKRGFRTYFASPNADSQSQSLCDSKLVADTAGLNIAGEKRKRAAGPDGESFELSSSQSWTKGKRLRSSQIRTPVRL